MTRAERRRRTRIIRRRRVDRIKAVGLDYYFANRATITEQPGREDKHAHRPVYRSDPDIGIIRPAILRAMLAAEDA